MATSNASGDSTDTQVNRTNISGDVYFVNRFSRWWWGVAAVACLLVPPAGVFLATYLALSCVETGDPTVYADVDD